ncbi:MAG: HAD family hydrolase [Promethearchaeota archaeon]
MIQAITFDLWNTLFTNKFYSDMRISFFTNFLETRGIIHSFKMVKEAFSLAFNLPPRNLERIKYHHIYTMTRISKMLEILEIKFSESDKNLIKQNFEEVMLIDPPPLKTGVKQTLKKLSSNYKLGLISNTGVTPGRIIKKVFENYKILQYFHITLFSDETGFYKPSPIMFETALKNLNCEPQNAIHVGDLLETDIKGAKEYNMLTIWINDSFSSRSINIQPDFEIQQIPELIEIIERLK